MRANTWATKANKLGLWANISEKWGCSSDSLGCSSDWSGCSSGLSGCTWESWANTTGSAGRRRHQGSWASTVVNSANKMGLSASSLVKWGCS